ncbi:MAG: Rne/Rng family ribonuclease, partial [Anaerotignum sp.]|nr:Rne/Rng family ribonuclease [Anaerotignum sp.]
MKRVLMDISADLTRIALAENGELMELYYESKRDESLVGNIYAGRVANVMPNLQAAFVDIGVGKNGYYYYGNARAVSDAEKNLAKPKVGDTLILQVEKDAVSSKGAVLSANFSFPGKFLVLLPKDAGEIGVSRKITSSEERNRIREIVGELLPEGCGAIVRTNGEGKTREEFEKEISVLAAKAEKLKTGEFIKPPALLLQENHPVKRAARDFYAPDVDEYVVNDKNAYEELLETGDYNGENQPALKLHEEKLPLFESYFLESQSERALDEHVWLKSGGFLVIEETEACVVIDVNTGKAAGKGDLQKTILKTNLEAAEEAAKQMRLRNLSGIIIIDFIDMADPNAQKEVTKRLEAAVKKDRIKTVVVGMTELGLMQVTRKKTRPSLKRQMTTKCR